jgi:hypothetical protein
MLAWGLAGMAGTASAAIKTWNTANGGAWTTPGHWTPSGVPADGDDVTIPADQTGDITSVPQITLSNFTVNGNCTFDAATSKTNTITVTNSFSVAVGKTFILGGSGSSKLNFTMASTCSGTIAGTVSTKSGQSTFLCNGNLTMTSAGLIDGPGVFTLGAGATLQIGSPDGISSSGNGSGNIQVTGGLNYNAAANYVYVGPGAQNTGNGLPNNLTGSLTINDPGGTVTLNNGETIFSGGTLNIVSGTFAAGANLTMATLSTINRSGGSMTGKIQGTGLYNVNYTGNSMATSSELSGAGLTNVVVSLSGGQTLTLSTNASPDGNLTVNSGTLNLSTNSINRSTAGGTFTLANGASLLVGGTSNFPSNYSTVSLGAASTVNYDASGPQTVAAETYGNLVFSGSGAKSMPSGTSVTGNLSITGSASASVGAGLALNVGTLTLGGLGTASGTWGSTTATTATYHNNTYFGPTTGYLIVGGDTRTTPAVSIWPTASGIIYGQTLAASTLSGGSMSVPGTFAFTSPSTAPNAGTASQNVTFTPTDLSLYNPVAGSVSVTVSKADPVVTTWPAANPITYGQTLAASTLSGGSATPVGTFGFTTPSTAPNAGTASQNVTYTPTDTANYNTAAGTVSVTVNKASPNVTAWPTASTITYGQTLASSSLTGGSATPAGTFAFTSTSIAPSAGTASQNVTYTPTDTANYNTASSTVSVTVNKKGLTVTGITASDKDYDGNTTATLNTASAALVGVINSDDVTLNTSESTGTFSDANVGSGKTVQVSGLTLNGTTAGNYSVTQPTTTAQIRQAGLTVTGIEAVTKVYDATNTATLILSNAVLVGVVSGDTVTLDTNNAAGTFADKKVGTAKVVSVSGLALLGADAAKYTLTQPTTNADITPASLTVTGITASDKVYNGDTTATLNTAGAALVGVISGDDVSLDTSSAAGSFSDANVGTSKTVQVSGLNTSGADAANYALTQPTTTANISKADSVVTTWPTAGDINYGETLASSTLNGGSATPAGTFAFTSPSTAPNAGTASQSVTYTPTDTANYNTSVGTVSVTVNKANPNVTAWPTASGITYGQTLASAILSGGSATPPGGFAFTSPSIAPSAGTAPQSVTYTPTDTANYNTASSTVSVIVAKKGLTVTGITANNKVFDGNTTATLNTAGAALVGVINSDDVTLNTGGTTGSFSDANAGLGKSVQIGGLTLGGTTAGNYSLTQPTTTANITSPPLGDINDGLVVWIAPDTGGEYVFMKFKRNKNAAVLGYQYLPQVSADKLTWFSDGSHVLELSVVSFDSQFDYVTVRDVTPTTTPAPRFIQLKVLSIQ